MILADKRDYKTGYRKHYHTYQLLNSQNGAILSKRLLLVYSVECGLKYILLDKWEVVSSEEIREILSDKTHPKHTILGTHNLRKILKELGQEGEFHFPDIATAHKDNISIEEYHQMQRYGIQADDRDISKEKQLEKVLQQIADWIEEEM